MNELATSDIERAIDFYERLSAGRPKRSIQVRQAHR
jgi:predicted enzyme related to lactoylglutathione lyase